MNTSQNDAGNSSTSQFTPDVILAQKSQGKNKLAGGASSAIVSSPTSPSNKSIASKNNSNSYMQSELKEYISSKEPNVGQGSES